MRESSSFALWIRIGCLVEVSIVGEFTGLIALPEFMSIEAPGGITHERFYPGEFDPDSQTASGRIQEI
jgi:hypothetical protein